MTFGYIKRVGWKDCHRYFVENPNEYKRFKNDVGNFMQGKTTTTTNKPSAKGEFYTVKSGDSLWSIASNNLSIAELQELNSEQDLNPLLVVSIENY